MDEIDHKYSYYNMTRREGLNIIFKASSAYDKAIISLSTASFGFIAALVKFSHHQLECKPFLMVILILLILSIFCSLLSFWFDQLFGVSILEFAEESRENEGEEYKKHWSYYASITTKISSGTFFFLAIILFSILFYVNL